MNLNKSLIAQRFARARQSYVENAIAQKKISHHLCHLMQAYCPLHLSRIFEIGCGSGNLTQELFASFQIQKAYLNDLYDEVKQHFLDEQPIEWCIGDIESLSLPEHLNAIVSSSAIQWVQNLPQLLSRCHHALNDQGWLCFSTFGADNFKEIKQLTGQGLSYWSVEEWQVHLQASGFELMKIEQQQLKMQFDSPRAILKHLKATGVTGTVTTTQPHWNKQSLAQFYHDYCQFQTDDGHYELTYHPIYIIARRMS